MSIYLLTEAIVHDVETFKKYKEQAPQYVARHTGEYCCRGGKAAVHVGDWLPDQIVLLKIPSGTAYEAFITDPDYRPWKEIRKSLTTVKTQLLLLGV